MSVTSADCFTPSEPPEKFLARVDADALRLSEETLKVCNMQFAKQSVSDTTAIAEGLSRELSKTDAPSEYC